MEWAAGHKGTVEPPHQTQESRKHGYDWDGEWALNRGVTGHYPRTNSDCGLAERVMDDPAGRRPGGTDCNGLPGLE